MCAVCGTQIGIGDRRTLLDRKRKGKRRDPLGASPQKAGLASERLGCEGDFGPSAWANDLLYTEM